MDILRSANIPVPRGLPAYSVPQALECAKSLNTDDLVIKAQVLAGGRGKGTFSSGLVGGVKLLHRYYYYFFYF